MDAEGCITAIRQRLLTEVKKGSPVPPERVRLVDLEYDFEMILIKAQGCLRSALKAADELPVVPLGT